MGDPSTFTIKELTGKRRQIDLRGRALPYRPFSLKGKMRADFTWYPGNATASVQMLGAQEDTTTIKGQWKDRFVRSVTDAGVTVQPTAIAVFTNFDLGDGQARDVMALVNAMDQIRRGGQLLEVTWDAVKREGIMLEFSPSWNRREWVEWEVQFGWVSQGEPPQPVTFPKLPEATDFATALGNMTATLREVILAPFSLTQSFSTSLSSAVGTIEDTAFELANLSTQVADQVATPIEAAERSLAAAETVKSTAGSITTLFTSTPLRLQRNVTSPGSLTVGEVLAIDTWGRDVRRTAREIQALAAEKGDELRDSVNQTDLLATFVARAPTDLRDVSRVYYGTADEWRRLLKFNALTSSKLVMGQLIQVPKLQYADRSA